MFVRLNIDVNGTVVEKTFDNLKSLKENYFSMNMAHTLLDVVLMDGFECEKFARELFKVVWDDKKSGKTISLIDYDKEEDLLIFVRRLIAWMIFTMQSITKMTLLVQNTILMKKNIWNFF